MVTVLEARVELAVAVDVGERLLQARELVFFPCSDVFLPTFETFRGQGGRGWSFVDAAIATVARRHPPGRVATFDAGFQGLDGIEVIAG